MKNLTFVLRASIFGDFSKIKVNPETSIKLTSLFSQYGFIPSIYQEIYLNELQKRQQLLEFDQGWNIKFGINRIDVEKTLNPKNRELNYRLPDFIGTAMKYLNIIIAEFDIMANRLALFSDNLIVISEKKVLDDIYRNLTNPLDAYRDVSVSEWNLRSVTRKTVKDNGWEEIFNVIVDVSRSKGTIQLGEDIPEESIDDLRIYFDINTVPESDSLRFDASSLEPFFSNALRFVGEISLQMEGRFNVNLSSIR